MATNVRDELLAATRLSPKPNEDEAALALRVALFLNDDDDDTANYDRLSSGAKSWHERATDVIDGNKRSWEGAAVLLPGGPEPAKGKPKLKEPAKVEAAKDKKKAPKKEPVPAKRARKPKVQVEAAPETAEAPAEKPKSKPGRKPTVQAEAAPEAKPSEPEKAAPAKRGRRPKAVNAAAQKKVKVPKERKSKETASSLLTEILCKRPATTLEQAEQKLADRGYKLNYLKVDYWKVKRIVDRYRQLNPAQ